MVAQLNTAFVRARPAKIWPRLLGYALFEGRPLTTRGRWLNPLVFALYRLWARFPLGKHDPNPIFILGVGRSGTTVLGSILALHRDVAYLNEPKALWQAALGDDDLIGSYSARPGRYRMEKSDATASNSGRLHRFYAAYLGLSGCRRIVDKYPELIFRTGLLDAVFPGARKLVLVRNGADICQSIQRWSQIHGQSTHRHTDDWWGRKRRKWHILVDEVVSQDPIFTPHLDKIRAFSCHRDMAAVEWVASMRQLAHLQEQKTDGLHVVRYEELIAEPTRTVAGILQFCGLSDDTVVLNYARKILVRKTLPACLELDPAIQPAFDHTMQALGYWDENAA